MKNFISKIKKTQRRNANEQSSIQIGSPTDLILQVPRPRLDANGRPVQATDHEIDGDTMRTALINVAVYLQSKDQSLVVIAIGGAVNVLLLRSRTSTHDLDFLGTHLDNEQLVALDEAALDAEMQSSKPLGAEWFHNQNQMWLAPSMHRQITN